MSTAIPPQTPGTGLEPDAAAASESTSLAAAGRATLVLTGGAVVVQIIGLFRQLFLAARVGIDSGLDALLIALAVPTAVVALLASGVAVALVPAYIQVKEEQGAAAARRLAGTVLTWVGIASLLVAVPLWLSADGIIAITGPGLAEEGVADDAVRYLQLLAPMAFVSSIMALLYATCQAERMFPAMLAATVAGPLIALATMIVFWASLALDGLVIGTIAGEVISIAVMLVALAQRRLVPKPRLVSKGLGLRDLIRHAAPLTVSRGLVQLQGLFDRAVASILLPGGVSALRYGDSLVRLPFGAIRPAFNAATYPTLVHASRGSGGSDLGLTAERLIRYGLVAFVPLAGLTIAVAPIATALLYDRGAFGDADVALTAGIVALSAPLIVTWTVQPSLVSALNARRRGAILLVGGILTTVGNIVLDVVFGYVMGIAGIPLASVVVSAFVVAYMANRLSRLEPSFSTARLARIFVKATIAILPAAVALGIPIWTGALDGDVAQRILVLVGAGVGGLAAYYLMCRWIGLTEAASLVAFGVETTKRMRPRWLHRS